MNHTTTTKPTTNADDEITTVMDQWTDERTSRSDERDERTTSAGLDSASMLNMFGPVA
jgi:hypothetical protein